MLQALIEFILGAVALLAVIAVILLMIVAAIVDVLKDGEDKRVNALVNKRLKEIMKSVHVDVKQRIMFIDETKN